jgi:hypothetical protein
LDLSTYLLSSFASIFNLKTGKPEFEIMTKTEMVLEGVVVGSPSSKEGEFSGAPIEFEPVFLFLTQIFLIL